MENNLQDKEKGRELFNTRLGMILSTVGFAAGVGNIWRFPYIVGANGGGIFILFYLLIIAIMGIPLLTAEFSIGAEAGVNPVAAYSKLTPGKKWRLIGWLHLIAAILIAGYTTPVYAWILYYLYNTAIGTLQGLSPDEIGVAFETLIVNRSQLFFWSGINVALIILVVRKKLQDGIEKIRKYYCLL